jgi:hypothetical protein
MEANTGKVEPTFTLPLELGSPEGATWDDLCSLKHFLKITELQTFMIFFFTRAEIHFIDFSLV